MKKIYLKPEMELTECFMLITALCESQPDVDNPDDPFAPKRKVF